MPPKRKAAKGAKLVPGAKAAAAPKAKPKPKPKGKKAAPAPKPKAKAKLAKPKPKAKAKSAQKPKPKAKAKSAQKPKPKIAKLSKDGQTAYQAAKRAIVREIETRYEQIEPHLDEHCPDLERTFFLAVKNAYADLLQQFSAHEGMLAQDFYREITEPYATPIYRGIRVGDAFPTKLGCRCLKAHTATMAGIATDPQMREDSPIEREQRVASSIAISDWYSDDMVGGEWGFLYTGMGGQVNNGFVRKGESRTIREQGQQTILTDQTLERGNRFLWNNNKRKIPVRVIKKFNVDDYQTLPEDVQDHYFVPKVNKPDMYVYCGEVSVASAWWAKAKKGANVWRFLMLPTQSGLKMPKLMLDEVAERKAVKNMAKVYGYTKELTATIIPEDFFDDSVELAELFITPYPTLQDLQDAVLEEDGVKEFKDNMNTELTFFFCITHMPEEDDSRDGEEEDATSEGDAERAGDGAKGRNKKKIYAVVPFEGATGATEMWMWKSRGFIVLAPFKTQWGRLEDYSCGLENAPILVESKDNFPSPAPFTYLGPYNMALNLSYPEILRSRTAPIGHALQIFRSEGEGGETIGWRLRTLERIEEGSIIGGYSGLVCASQSIDSLDTQSLYLASISVFDNKKNRTHTHLDQIDAHLMGSATRFVCHSADHCNVSPDTILYEKNDNAKEESDNYVEFDARKRNKLLKPKINAKGLSTLGIKQMQAKKRGKIGGVLVPEYVLKAKRVIYPGEELLMDYGRNYKFPGEMIDIQPENMPDAQAEELALEARRHFKPCARSRERDDTLYSQKKVDKSTGGRLKYGERTLPCGMRVKEVVGETDEESSSEEESSTESSDESSDEPETSDEESSEEEDSPPRKRQRTQQ